MWGGSDWGGVEWGGVEAASSTPLTHAPAAAAGRAYLQILLVHEQQRRREEEALGQLAARTLLQRVLRARSLKVFEHMQAQIAQRDEDDLFTVLAA